MSVRPTESRLPPLDARNPTGARIAPSALGRAVTAGNFALISYLEGPLLVGSLNEYVVFAWGGVDVTSYTWQIDPRGGGPPTLAAQVTDTGVFEWRPDLPGEYVVTVTLAVASGPVVLQLHHRVVPWFPIDTLAFSFLKDELNLAQHGGGRPFANVPDGVWRAFTEHCASVAESEVTREIAGELWLPIFDAAYETDPQGIPPLLLAGVLFNETYSRPKEYAGNRPFRILGMVRKNEMASYAIWLNGGRRPWQYIEGGTSLGVGQIQPATAARALGILPWAEDPKAADIDVAYQALPLETRIDVFNLLRFPRSNVRIAAALLVQLKNRPHRYPTLATDAVISTPNVVEVLASEYNMGPRSAPLDELKRITNKNGPVIRALVGQPYLTAFYPVLPHVEVEYGDFDLRVGDADGSAYAGAPPPDPTKRFIHNVGTDLVAMGFATAATAASTGSFDIDCEWAVRELQGYMKMDNVARLRADVPSTALRTDAVRKFVNVVRYDGPVSGVLNVATRRILRAWRALDLRCPLVISAWNTPANVLVPGADNLWKADDVLTTAGPRVRAQDYTQYFDIPDARIVDGRVDVGEYTPVTGWGGGASEARYQSWSGPGGAEVLPLPLTGEDSTSPPVTDADRQKRSTFKVVRAACEQENEGYFDVLNAWDGAVMSVGLCHWTLALINQTTRAVSDGELGGFFAYLAAHEPATFQRALGFFGVGVRTAWGSPALFDTTLRKYATWLTAETEDYSFAPIPQDEDHTTRFRAWPWFYRFQMAARTLPRFNAAMWPMARIRIRDILATPWPSTQGPVLASGATPTIGDVYTCERAVAQLMRWHVLMPAHVVRPASQNQATCLQAAFVASGLPVAMASWVTPQRTADQVQVALLAGLEQILTFAFNATFPEARNWPTWEGGPNPKHYTLQPGQLAFYDDPPSPGLHRRLRTAAGSFQIWPLQPGEL